MGFRLVSKSVTLNDLVRRNNPYFVHVISPNSVALGAHYVKVVEDSPILSATKMYYKECILVIYHLWRYSRRLPRTNALSRGTCAT